jgi:hypothetical protein
MLHGLEYMYANDCFTKITVISTLDHLLSVEEFKNTTRWPGGVAQMVECLTNKHKALSSNPSTGDGEGA